jgi:hypothetical protein
MRWLWFVREDDDGIRWYRLKDADEHQPVKTVHGVTCHETARKLEWVPDANMIKLRRRDFDSIVEFGDLIS